MNALIVYANPEPSSFCAGLMGVAIEVLQANGHQVVVSDLYGEHFNPVAGRHDFKTVADPARFHYQQEQLKAFTDGGFASDIEREQLRVANANLYLFIYPLWWGGMPAILKGWFDRVLAYGFAYSDGKRFDTGYFKGRHALTAVTTGGTTERFSEGGVYGPIDSLLYPQKRTMLEYLGLNVAPTYVAYAVPRVSQRERENNLQAWKQRVSEFATDAERMSTHPENGFANSKKSLTGWNTCN
jgi:NAD(P)H dehydrogenase (quinone)